MAYVGNQPVPQATQTRDRFVATSGQTSFATSGYTPNFVDVYLDGVKLDTSEFTATNGSDVVLDTGASTGQILEVVAFSSFDVADIRNMTQPLGLKNYTTTERNALTNLGAGDTIYNSTTGSIEFYDGANWIATNLIPTVNSVSGTIYAGLASTLTLSITNATETVTVRFSEGGVTVADVADVSVTSGSASVSVPSSVYGQTAGDTISVSILNQDGTPSSNAISKTVIGLPTGGTITSSGGYRYHTFTSSSTFSTGAGFSKTVQTLVLAGGGGGGSWWGGGGGAGGYVDTSASVSANTNYTIVVGAGAATTAAGSPSVGANGSNSTALSLTAIGGGGGSANTAGAGKNGGSGGGGGRGEGGSSAGAGGSGTSGQGFAGGAGAYDPGESGGGGGAGGAGTNSPNSNGSNPGSANGTNGRADGGIGKTWFDGVNRAGGGGNTWGTNSYGGGSGQQYLQSANASAGEVNKGGGGGGSYSSGTGGAGGSGIVIIRYQI